MSLQSVSKQCCYIYSFTINRRSVRHMALSLGKEISLGQHYYEMGCCNQYNVLIKDASLFNCKAIVHEYSTILQLWTQNNHKIYCAHLSLFKKYFFL